MSTKNILVSGANGNLGKAVVNYFLKKRNNVIGLVHHKKEEINHKNYEEFEVDLTDEEEVQKCVKNILEKYKQIHAGVLTTGGFAMGTIENTGIKELHQQYALNFETAYNVARPLFLDMKNHKTGKIFFIGSEPGMNTAKGKSVVAYALAKSQLFQLANLIKAESKTTKIQTHVIVPSTIDTPENRKSVPDANFKKWQKPEDIAKLIGKYTKNYRSSKTMIIVEEEL